jgi:hypothetical protein
VAERRRGIVVDPARRDALVARFRILSMQSDTVTALVTGQTTLVTAQHVVVMNPPPPATWYKRSDVWRGSALGALAGLIVGGLLF